MNCVSESLPIPAATVVVMRDTARGAPELLMVERSAAMAFAGGALVFPGGRVDPGDAALAEILAPGDSDAPARIAAVREAVEEAGVAPGVVGGDDRQALATLRKALHDGDAMGEALAASGLSLDLSALVPFARWLPKGVTHRIFDTHFYLAQMPDGAPEPRVDATENTRLVWLTAEAALAEADAGRVRVIFPTRRNLERLARYASFVDAVADARAIDVRTVTPWIEERGGEKYLCIPDDLGYPVTAEPLATANRA